MEKYAASDLAKYVIQKHKDAEIGITNLRLQKLLYYVQGYFLKKFDSPAFEEGIYRWAYGPVVVDVYYEYCSNGADDLPPPTNGEFENIEQLVLPEHARLLSKVLDATYSIPVGALVNRTHGESPWAEAQDRGLIAIDSIKKFFDQNNPLQII